MIERFAITDREAWLARRMLDLTASDIGAAAGVGRFKTRLQLWAEKTGRAKDQPDNDAMQRGRWLEAAVLSAIRETRPGWQVEKANEYLRDPELRLGATPDAVATTADGELVNVQCKVVARPAYERHWAKHPPTEYLLQTTCEGMLTGMASFLAALVVDTHTARLHLHPVPRHVRAEARIVAIAKKFWADIEAGIKPPADYGRDADTVAALWPQSEPEPVLDLTGDNRLPDLLAMRAVLKGEADGIEKQIKTIDTEIKDKLGPHELAMLPGWKLSWKTHHRKEAVTAAYDYRPLVVTDLREDIEEEAA